jgi:signal transduction histidine kinase
VTRSLRKRLVLILLLLMLFAWISSAVLTVMASSRVLIDQVDRQLTQYSDLVYYMTQVFAQADGEKLVEAYPWLQDAVHTDDWPMIIEGPLGEDLSPALNIWHREKLIATLEESPRFKHPEREGYAFQRDPDGEGGWRILVRHHAENDLWLLVGIDLDRARWSILQVFGRALFPLLIVLPLTVVLLYFGVTRGLLPLKQLAGQIGQRSPQSMEPIEQEDVPEELAPVIESLNELLERLGEALESEQRFTANAAHELQTPLAAIKAEVQLCQRQSADEQARNMLERIASRVDRASHTVEQLMTLARLDPEASINSEALGLRGLLAELIAETAHTAVGNELSLNFPEGEEMKIKAERESLSILLRNALLNAFRYATPGSEVRVELSKEKGRVTLNLINDCDPISKHHFEQLRERFYRVPGSTGTGAGLGLSIVQRVADRHGAELRLGPYSEDRGFDLRLRFRPA